MSLKGPHVFRNYVDLYQPCTSHILSLQRGKKDQENQQRKLTESQEFVYSILLEVHEVIFLLISKS